MIYKMFSEAVVQRVSKRLSWLFSLLNWIYWSLFCSEIRLWKIKQTDKKNHYPEEEIIPKCLQNLKRFFFHTVISTVAFNMHHNKNKVWTNS